MMKKWFALPLVAAVFFCSFVFTVPVFGQSGVTAVSSSPAAYPGDVSDWNGFERHDFTFDGRGAIIVKPHEKAEGRPWVWRARFFGHRPEVDIALLGKGCHLVYIDVAGMFGSPQAVALWDAFYAYLTAEHGFADKTALEGLSRGGLIVYNWASVNPEKTACIYADAPVCDFKSWPGGKGAGNGSPDDWKKCLEAYGLTEEEALDYRHNPIDNLEPLASHHVPLLHVCGGADTVVPIEENTRIMEKRYRNLGGSIAVIVKDGVGHHPHGPDDPSPIIGFILKYSFIQQH